MVGKRLGHGYVPAVGLLAAQVGILLFFFGGGGPACAASAPAVAPNVVDVPDSAAYLLVIDHSGSMLTQDQPAGGQPGARARWQAAKAKLKEFVEQAPLGSLIWIAIFSFDPQVAEPPFKTQEDRKRLLDWIEREYREPQPQAGTWLYETLAVAFERAQGLLKENANRHISVILFSDGEDNKSPHWTAEKLREKYRDVTRRGQHVWIFGDLINLPDKQWEGMLPGVPVQPTDFQKHPRLMTLRVGAVRLKNAKLHPKQQFELSYFAPEETWGLVRGQEVRFDFVPGTGQGIRAVLRAATLREGPVLVDLEVLNADQLQGDREYSGKLKIHYPALKQNEIYCRDTVEITFQKEPLPEISWRIPRDNDRFAARQPIQFKVSTLAGTDVTWEFGDGQTATGADVRHAYSTAGRPVVKVKLTNDPRIGSTVAQIPLEIIDVDVSINPVHELLVEGIPHRFTCQGHREVERYRWQIDGNFFDGRACKDPAEGNSEITYTFHSPGLHEVSLAGYAKGAEPTSKRTVEVKPRPAVLVSGGPTRPFQQPVAIKLESPDGWEQAEWDFGDGSRERGTNANPVHKYHETGVFEVKARLTWKDGRQLDARPASVTVVAEPPVAVPRVVLGDQPATRVRAGQTVRLLDDSTGDVVHRVWSYDGREIPSSEVSLPLLEPGDHELTLRVEGPPDRSGSRLASDPRTHRLHVVLPPNYYPFGASLVLGLVILAASGKLLLRNGPRHWLLYASNRGEPDEDTDVRVPLREGWNWWEKYALVPIGRLFPACSYWTGDDGRDQYLKVTAVPSGSRLVGSVAYSGEQDDRVVTGPSRGDDTRTDYHWTDNRCAAEDPASKQIYVRLVMKHRASVWPAVALTGVLAAVAALCGTIYYYWVYQGSF